MKGFSAHLSGMWFLLFLTSCTVPIYTSAGKYNGVNVAYKWHQRGDRPGQLRMRLRNTTNQDRRVDLRVDVTLMDGGLEHFTAEACLGPKEAYGGWFRGIHFVPEQGSADAPRGAKMVDANATIVDDAVCY